VANNMDKKMPSIFNDVIGPVMRGPSSSHTAASWRIARVCLEILGESLKKALIEFDQNGAWASNYREQGTVMGINGGLLGLDIADDRMKDSDRLCEERGVEISYGINSFPTKHTNTVRLTLEGESDRQIQIVAVSTGGGAFEIQKVDKFKVSIHGDSYEALYWYSGTDNISEQLAPLINGKVSVSQSRCSDQSLITIKTYQEIPLETLDRIEKDFNPDRFVTINPILPIIAGNGSDLPFDKIRSLIDFSQKNEMGLGQTGLLYEKCQSGLSEQVLCDKMETVIKIIHGSIEKGLKGTVYKDRILPQQSHLIEKAVNEGQILKNTVVNNIIAYVSAIMEAKSAMEVIVANPTAGSCGVVGGVIRAVAEEWGVTSEDVIKAYFAAGIVGAYFAQGPGFSAEAHGCQVECGASSGMAAAGIVQLMGGSAKEAINAASMAIQNMIGLVCDPVADRVEVPCLGKNISAAMNALSSATMARSGFDPVIPLDEVIETVSRVGDMMPACVKCTGQGGLAITTTSIQLKKRLES
jgi:L-serine dehydratase